MTALVFDTETSGLWRDDLPLEDDAQPHLLQLSAALVDDDWNIRGEITSLVRPTGWSIEPEASEVHGITEMDATRFGIPDWLLLGAFRSMVDQARVVVAQNLEWERKLILSAVLRTGNAPDFWTRIPPERRFCTMEQSAPVLGLEGKIPGVPKFPTLAEAKHFFYPEIEPREGHHSAKADRDDCLMIYRAMMERQNA